MEFENRQYEIWNLKLMIVSFTLENWKSFRNTTNMSLVTRDLRSHEARVQSLDQIGVNILPIVAIYGGNASGKTNLIDALKFARLMVLDGTKDNGVIPVIPFLLGEEDGKNPTKLKFQLIIDETFYEYHFTVTSEKVLEEVLKKVQPDNSEELLYHRTEQLIKFGPKIDPSTVAIINKSTKKSELILHIVQLFDFEKFLPVFDWFKNSLSIISPDMKLFGLHDLVEEKGALLQKLNLALYYFDTGMTGLEIAKLDSKLAKGLINDGVIPSALFDEQFSRNLSLQDSSLSIRKRNGEPELLRLFSNHYISPEKTVRFDLNLESEGSKRLLDLLPSLLDLTSNSKLKVLIIDELDRSMHPDLTAVLIKKYLATSNKQTRNQLIFTTHDISLLDKEIFRRDEIWFTERKNEEISRLFSFGDFIDIEENENFSELYNSGVLGGKPHIYFKHSITNPFLDSKDEDED